MRILNVNSHARNQGLSEGNWEGLSCKKRYIIFKGPTGGNNNNYEHFKGRENVKGRVLLMLSGVFRVMYR